MAGKKLIMAIKKEKMRMLAPQNPCSPCCDVEMPQTIRFSVEEAEGDTGYIIRMNGREFLAKDKSEALQEFYKYN